MCELQTLDYAEAKQSLNFRGSLTEFYFEARHTLGAIWQTFELARNIFFSPSNFANKVSAHGWLVASEINL